MGNITAMCVNRRIVQMKDSKATPGKLAKQAGLEPDIERLMIRAYGAASNKDFVRHGRTRASTLTCHEAEFFLDFSAASIVYFAQSAKIKP